TDIAIITKKWPKPDKNKHEIVKSAQKPDPKTLLYTKVKPRAQQKPMTIKGTHFAINESGKVKEFY
nr:hypothetical protein [Tanacetum cinerariifolium]